MAGLAILAARLACPRTGVGADARLEVAKEELFIRGSIPSRGSLFADLNMRQLLLW